MRRTAFVCLVALLFARDHAVAQQTGTITGVVTSIEGARPLPGVQIFVVGTQTGGLTRDDGRYTIAVNPGTYTLRARRIGYAPDSATGIVVAAGGTASANFQLTPLAISLSKMVVIGYGEQRERDKTGVVATVTSDQFNTGRVVSPEELIKAKVPGVQVQDNNEPGGGLAIRIRGGSSVTSSNEPLFVVDGVPLSVGGGVSAGRNPLNFLNPDDIESITVLRDASSTAIYGSRGANGVVIIKTKAGTEGTQVTLTSSVSSSRVNAGPQLLNASQFRAAVNQYAPENINRLGAANTNWLSAVERNAMGSDNTLAVAGNKEDMRYRLSLGYFDQGGILLGTSVKRLSTALAYNDDLFDHRLNLQANVKGARSDDNFTPGSVIGSASAFAPTQPVLASNGSFFEWSDPLAPGNPLAELQAVTDHGTTYRSVGNLQTKYRMPFLEGLSTTLNLGYDVAKADRTSFYPSIERSQLVNSLGGTVSRNSSTQANTVLDAYATYARVLDSYQSDIDVTAGYSYEQSKGDFPSFFAQGLASDLLGPNGVPAAKLQRNSIYTDESRLVSGFGRVNYSLMDRYLATLTVRKDGSSKFGPTHQWGTFPSAALAWRVSKESFLSHASRLSDLKLRASWGVNGNQAFPNYQAYSAYLIGNSQAQVQFGNEFVTTIRPGAVDPNIRWEQTTSTNLGVDFGFFENRVSGTLDHYFKKTKDLIFNVPVAAGTNLSNFVTTNIGSLQNSGLELGLNARVMDGGPRGFTWDAGFNAATNKNKLLRINAVGAGTEQILTGGISGGVGTNIQVLQPGYPINSFFVYRHKTGADGRPVTGDKSDFELYQDINGDSVINQSDRVPYKSPNPKWMLGFSSQMGYRNFDMNFTLRSYLGNYVYNNVASNLGHYSALKGNAPVNLSASVLKYGFVGPQYFSDLYVEDGSFLRMDNITLGYTIRGLRAVSSLRVFGAVQNVFTLTHYSGVDPTAGINGLDNNIYPRSRIFLAGTNLAF